MKGVRSHQPLVPKESFHFSDASLGVEQVMVTAFTLWQSRSSHSVVLPSGCDSIDSLLQGGFRSGIVTEICGEASAGKTQLCLQLLLQCCLPRSLGGLESTACYVCTEGVGSMKRLHDLAQVYAKRYNTAVLSSGTKRKHDDTLLSASGSDFLDGIFIEKLYAANDLMDLVQARLPMLLAEETTKLVVLDSVAAVFRLESTSSVKAAAERSRSMFHMVNCMRVLSDQYGVVFIVTNQVTGDFTSCLDGNGMRPALGLSWSHCISQRLVITRHEEARRRQLKVAFSPYLPAGMCTFQVTSEVKEMSMSVLSDSLDPLFSFRNPSASAIYRLPKDLFANLPFAAESLFFNYSAHYIAMVSSSKQSRYPLVSPCSNNACEIRSGMSVQDLKHLTAQRQRLECWARNSPRQTAMDYTYASSPSSTCSSSFSSSPPSKFSDGSCYSAAYGYIPPQSRRGFASDKMFVTCGGQMVSFMVGVVNAPLGDV